MMTPERARQLLEAATPGPWTHAHQEYEVDGPNDEDICAFYKVIHGNFYTCDNIPANRALIEAAPDLARAYLDAMERIAELEAVREAAFEVVRARYLFAEPLEGPVRALGVALGTHEPKTLEEHDNGN